MSSAFNYWLAQALIIIFYVITLVVYHRARNEYIGGKIGAAINLIIIFMVILLLSDFVDYFFIMIMPLGEDTILIIKILLRLIAICVLFFGGLRFFVTRPVAVGQVHVPDTREARPLQPKERPVKPAQDKRGKTVVLEKAAPRALPTLGRYEIIEQIGRGAMGIVYKGRDPMLNRLTAIKTIRFVDEFDEDQIDLVKKQFYREAEVVAKLAHPNIVTVYDVGEDLDLNYLAMEYLEGESLVKYTRPGNLLPIRQCVEIITQGCDALEYAHKHDIVHRDIKPENIMVLKDGTVKVTDFGIARVATSTRTRTGVIKGTPYYMSPEQTKGQALTGPSDIFSLGVVFYQLLTGKLPFTGDNLAAIMYQTTMVDPEPPTTFNPEIDPGIVAIIKRALEKSLERRYAAAKQMGDDLRRLSQKLADTADGIAPE
jgi:tRNA A-37 threonylcarbamoyl transferase component Bud32